MVETVLPNLWVSETLYAKAQLYMEQMESNTADQWQYGLWSALCLELLLRAALSNISPVLLANPNNWRNLNHALGNGPTAKKFVPNSIATKEVLDRLTELVPGFTKEVAGFCFVHTNRRNAELHTGETVFSDLGTSKWLPGFYQTCKLLLESMGKSLGDFVKDGENVQAMIGSLEYAVAESVTQDISIHSNAWMNKSDHEQETAVLQATAWATRQSGHRIKCPSCSSSSLLQGSPIGTVSTKVNDVEVVQKQTMLPSLFECIACGLKISGFSKLSSCGLGDAFSESTIYSAAEFFDLYTEDELQDAKNESSYYEPDFNED